MAVLKGYRTLIVAALLAALGAAQEIGAVALVGEGNAGWFAVAVAAIMAVLRWMTDSPVGRDV